jgi:gliding motility-associated-like protein
MEDKDFIKDLFNEQLSSYEAPVRPEMWSQVAGQLAAQGTVATTSIVTKIIIAATTVAAIGGLTYWMVSNESKNKSENIVQTEKNNQKPNVVEEKTYNNQQNHSQPHIMPEANHDVLPPCLFSDLDTEEPVIEMLSTTDEVGGDDADELTHTQPFEKREEPVLEKENLPSVVKAQPSVTFQSPQHEEVNSSVQTEENEAIGNLRNIFTPNGDGVNDFLSIESTGLSDFQVIVLDNRNKVVFQSTDPQFVWDGNAISGEPLATGNYVYFITARNEKGEKVNKYSTLRIER